MSGEIGPTQELRQFTKQFVQPDRDALAKTLRETRLPFFQRRQEIAELTQKNAENQTLITSESDGIGQLHLELENLSSSFITRHLKGKEISNLGQSIADAEKRKQEYLDQASETQSKIESLQAVQSNKQELKSAREQRDEFYKNQQLSLNRFKAEQELKRKQQEAKDRQARQIPSVVKERSRWQNIFFIHGIQPKFLPGENTILREGVTWKDKLRIVLALDPHLSTSAIRWGDIPSNMWARIGVILKDGEVTSAESQDAGTQVISLKRRRNVDTTPTPENISRALTHFGQHNEFTVINPKVAGFYVCSENEPGDDKDKRDLPPVSEIIQFAHNELGLPLFVFEKGRFFRGRPDASLKKILPEGEALTSTDILQSGYTVDQALREKLLQEIMADSPFLPEVLRSFEGLLLMSRDSGRETYLEINGGQIKKQFPAGAAIAQFPTVRRDKIICYIKDGRLYIKRRTHEGSEYNNPVDEWRGLNSTYIQIGPNTLNLHRNIVTNHDYFEGVERAFRDIQSHKDYAHLSADWRKHLSERLAFQVLGYGEQAEQLGDKSIQQRAHQIGTTVVPMEKYKQTTQRLGANGEFRLYLEDLQALAV